MGCSRPGSSIHGILQARVLEWVAISFRRGSSRPRNWTRVSCLVGRFFTNWATREDPIHLGCVHFLSTILVQSLSRVWPFANPWTTAGQASPSLPTPGVCSNSCSSSRYAIQPSHPPSSHYPPTFNLSQHQGLFQTVSSSHQVAKVLEFQLQHQSFQWTFRTDFL